MSLVAASPAYAKKIGPHGGRPLYVTLSGAQVVPGPGDANATGRATLTLNQGQGEICYTIQVNNASAAPTGASIYSGKSGATGALAVNLNAAFDANGYSKGCVTGLSKSLIMGIRQKPADYYLEVATPDGGVRGQLSKKG